MKLIEKSNLDLLEVKKVALFLRAINNKTRVKIIQKIDSKEKIIVTDIYKDLKMVQSVASQHLAILRRADIVLTERQGKFVYYTLNYGRLDRINYLVKDLLTKVD